MIIDWLISAGYGILFGIIPSCFWLTAKVVYASLAQRRNVPILLTRVFAFRSDLSEAKWGKTTRRQVLASRVFSISLVTIILVRYQYYAIADFLSGTATFSDIILLETGLTPFLLFTWLLPAYLLERYLRQQGTAGHNEPKEPRTNKTSNHS